MKRNSIGTTILRCLITLLPFVITYLVTKAFFEEVYLLEWLARHWYCGLWVIAIIIVFFNFKLSLVISYCNVIAIGLGQFVGDAIREYNISLITPDMSAEQQAHLHLHYGFPIWLLSLLLFMAVFVLVTYFQKKKRTN